MKCTKCGCKKSMVELICQVTFFHYEHEDGSEEGPWFEEDSDPTDRVRPIYLPRASIHTCMECGNKMIHRESKPVDPKYDESKWLERQMTIWPENLLDTARKRCEIEAKVIDEALKKGWTLPSLSRLWSWMKECLSDPERDPQELVPKLLEKAYPTEVDKWCEVVERGYLFMSAESFLEKLDKTSYDL